MTIAFKLGRWIVAMGLVSCLAFAQDEKPCTEFNAGGTKYVNQAKEVFEQSKILSIVPKLLDLAQIKDLIPIISEVEVKKDKEIADYLMLNEIYDRIGDPEKQVSNLQEAIAVLPKDPRPRILLALTKIENGDFAEGKQLLLDFAKIAQPKEFYLIAYALALAEPMYFLLVLLLLIWVVAILQFRRRDNKTSLATDIRVALPAVLFVLPMLLAITFWQTRKALPLGGLLLIFVLQLFFFFRPFLSKIYRPIFKFIWRVVWYLLNGTKLAKKMESLSSATRVMIAILSLFTLGTIVPTIAQTDLRYGLMFIASFLFYSTVGSLLISFFRSRESLFNSLKWVVIAATFPFLMSYLMANWNDLGLPLVYARIPSKAALDHLMSYLIYWGISLGLALHLGRILAGALVEPVNEIMHKVALIEGGDFKAKVQIHSRDEIGALANAVNRMGDGLAKREKIEKTFSKYIDKKVAERILDGVETELRIEGQAMPAVILFADIRGFTSMSEKATPQEMVQLLNKFFEKMVTIVQSHDGVVDKFIGDNLMAVWGVPQAVEKAEQKAIESALAMLIEMDKWNEELKSNGFPTLGVGIGINGGQVVAGSLGSSERMEYTVIGDVVNTAKRVEQAAGKQEVLVTAECLRNCRQNFVAQELEPMKVKGKENIIHTFRVTGLAKAT